MSSSLLVKSLKLLEQDNGCGNKNREKNLRKHANQKKKVLQLQAKEEQQSKRNIEENLQRIKLLNKRCTSNQVAQKIIQRVKENSIQQRNKKSKKRSKKKSVFTEKDFAKFEKEYQGN